MLNDLRLRLRALFRRKAVEVEMDEELRFHFENQVAKLMRSGWTPAEAQRRARLEFGGMEQIKEEYREARGVSFIGTFVQDIRFGLRILGRTPVITCVAVVSLALGIGAHTAIFSLIDTVMLRLLPVQKPEELVLLARTHALLESDPTPSFTNALWEEVRDHQDVFSGVFSWSDSKFDLSRGRAVRQANGIFTSGNYFRTLGVPPAAGRLMAAADDQPGCPGVAVLSYGFWQDHFGAAEGAVGGTISLDHHIFQIVGVSAPGFYGVEIGQNFDVAVPVCAAAIFDGKESRLEHRSWWWLRIIGRRKPGISVEQINARLGVISPEVFAGALPPDWDPQGKKDFLKLRLVSSPAATGTSYLRRRSFLGGSRLGNSFRSLGKCPIGTLHLDRKKSGVLGPVAGWPRAGLHRLGRRSHRHTVRRTSRTTLDEGFVISGDERPAGRRERAPGPIPSREVHRSLPSGAFAGPAGHCRLVSAQLREAGNARHRLRPQQRPSRKC
ncbi:MAG: hypothetical protein DMG53_07970 [Acidobacteria bacterium]|nr:MAG: hypothetical protein DMG53_07970 [Acidobacteriota bacterium]